jgi:hypothetical protein
MNQNQYMDFLATINILETALDSKMVPFVLGQP